MLWKARNLVRARHENDMHVRHLQRAVATLETIYSLLLFVVLGASRKPGPGFAIVIRHCSCAEPVMIQYSELLQFAIAEKKSAGVSREGLTNMSRLCDKAHSTSNQKFKLGSKSALSTWLLVR
jgi:hypothetical protein